MDNIETGVSTPEGLPRGEMDKLMNELLTNREAGQGNEPGNGAGGEWDQLTLLTGGFVPVGSIFWARPPKLKNQQRIMLTMQRAQGVMKPFMTEEGQDAQQEGFLEALFEQGNIMAKLAADLFYVYETEERQGAVADLIRDGKLTLTKSDFRLATEDEVTNDETGLTAEQIFDAMNRLMAMNQEQQGNA